jgi:hypothetical protein
MQVCKRQLSTMRKISQALIYLRGEADAAALDEVAAAIGNAERSVCLIYRRVPSQGAEEGGTSRDNR